MFQDITKPTPDCSAKREEFRIKTLAPITKAPHPPQKAQDNKKRSHKQKNTAENLQFPFKTPILALCFSWY